MIFPYPQFWNNMEQQKDLNSIWNNWEQQRRKNMVKYKASPSRSQGRESWSIIFRHPLRKDAKGKEGLRIRRGLGTADENKAKELVRQMNELLDNVSFWNINAKPLAEKQYDERIVSAFYDSLESEPQDYWAIREDLLPLPSSNDGYVRVLFIGAIGAGKTTLLRQVIGLDPKRDRFLSTSTGRTTTSDIEIIMSEPPFKAVVTFFTEAETRLLVEECVIEAVINAYEGGDPNSIARRLLEHKEQRFRLKYLLGNYKSGDEILEEDDDINSTLDDSQEYESQEQEIPVSEKDKLNQSLNEYIESIIRIANLTRERLNKQIAPISEQNKDKTNEQEIFEKLLLEEEEFDSLVNRLIDDIETRFAFVRQGSIECDSGDWPQCWKFETENREIFLEELRRFSDNSAARFGQLLTPLVQGIRVQGPLYPDRIWSTEAPKFVLMDGQGLGHTPDSASSLPTSLTQRFKELDVILLVDNAIQPMLASSIAVLRSVGASGHHSKLAIAFTHFDGVGGPNLRDRKAKKEHVFNAVRNGLDILKDILDQPTIRRMEIELENRCFFLGHLQKKLGVDQRGTKIELERLIDTFKSYKVVLPKGPAKPIYDEAYILFALQDATRDFHTRWSSLLGLSYQPGIPPAHWATVKALTRRIAYFPPQNDFGGLTPVGDLISRLSERISRYLFNPLGWTNKTLSEEEKQLILIAIKQKVNSDLHSLIRDCLIEDQRKEWVVAYGHRGQGSTKVRARDINVIYNKGAPLLVEVPSPESLNFLTRIRTVVNEAIQSRGGLDENLSDAISSNTVETPGIDSKNSDIEERMHGDVIEHKHMEYDYWHPASRIHPLK